MLWIFAARANSSAAKTRKQLRPDTLQTSDDTFAGVKSICRRRSISVRGPRVGIGFNGFVVGVEGGRQKEDGGDAADHMTIIAPFLPALSALLSGR